MSRGPTCFGAYQSLFFSPPVITPAKHKRIQKHREKVPKHRGKVPLLERCLFLNIYTHIYILSTPPPPLFFLRSSKTVLTTNFQSASVLLTGFNFLLLGDIVPLNQCLQDWSPGEFHPISCFIMKDSYSPTHHVSTVIYINFSVLKCCMVRSDKLK